MTIEYAGYKVYETKNVLPKGGWLNTLFGGPRTTSIELRPDPKDPGKDQVIVHATYGSYTLTGTEIISDKLCWSNNIRWHS